MRHVKVAYVGHDAVETRLVIYRNRLSSLRLKQLLRILEAILVRRAD